MAPRVGLRDHTEGPSGSPPPSRARVSLTVPSPSEGTAEPPSPARLCPGQSGTSVTGVFKAPTRRPAVSQHDAGRLRQAVFLAALLRYHPPAIQSTHVHGQFSGHHHHKEPCAPQPPPQPWATCLLTLWTCLSWAPRGRSSHRSPPCVQPPAQWPSALWHASEPRGFRTGHDCIMCMGRVLVAQ